jgi:predicted alpha/beta hydrolase family esterase
MRFFLIHGAYGNPRENWLPWLKSELERHGHDVIAPALPTPGNQDLWHWKRAFGPYGTLGESVLVGHSIGATFALCMLEKHKARAAFLVSAFTEPLGIAKFDAINKTFMERTFDWSAISKNCPHIELFHGDDDPYAPLTNARAIASSLRAPLHVIDGGKHLNEAAGYTTFPALLERIQLATR